MSLLPNEKTATKKPGDTRPTHDRIIAVFELISNGETLRKSCEEVGIGHSHVLKRVKADAELRAQYEAALESRHHMRFDELEREADGLEEKAMSSGRQANAVMVAFGHKFNLAKLRAEREAPKKYGARMQLAGDNEAPLMVKNVAELTDEQLALIALGNAAKP